MTSTDPSTREWCEIQAGNVRFLRAQDGQSERLLKNRLLELFIQRGDIRRAYLVKIDSEYKLSVALCLVTRFAPNLDIVQEIGKIFAHIFGKHEYLDILFLNKDQELALASVCAPFFGD